ncbi:MAG: ATP-binding protein [Dehalococcoidia bacterium]|nr:MAG: ATP-binding protein [Dehalococcoidia bacterium]
MAEKIQLGFTVPGDKPHHFEMAHIVATGMTQLSGKSTTVETILKRRKGKSLVFLTKRGEKTFMDARRVTPYYRERFDWEYVRGLLEAAWRERMKFETPWIIRICKKACNLKDVRLQLKSELERKRLREFDKNIYLLLLAYLDKVLPVLERAREKFTDRLELQPGINVMDLTPWYTHEEVQMLVIRACMEWILEHENNVVVGLPEAWKLLPQSRNTPVKLYFEKFIREGATNGNYLIIDAQDLGGVDKAPLRQVSVWIMGKMMEANEVERLLKQTVGLKVKAQEIQTLPLGHFIVAAGKTVEKVYVWPVGVPEDVARKVARGELTPEYVRDHYLKVKKEDDLVWKEKYLEEKRRREELEKEFARQVERVSDLKAKEKVKDLETRILNLGEGNKILVDEVEQLRLENKDLRSFKQLGEDANNLREAFLKCLRLDEPKAPRFEPGPSEVNVKTEQPTLTIETLREPLTLAQGDLLGRIAIVYAEGLLPDKAFTTTHLNKIMESRFGSKEFPGNLKPACNKFVAWNYFEKVQAGKRWDYRVKMKPETAREKGLLKVKEEPT